MFRHVVAISPADIDHMGHVNNSVYLKWVQDAVVDYWQSVAPADAVKQGEVKRYACDGRELFVCRPQGEWRVYDSRCPHQVTNIPLVALDGMRLTCPKHGWKFDIASGNCVEKGSRPLKRFDARVEGGRLQAYW